MSRSPSLAIVGSRCLDREDEKTKDHWSSDAFKGLEMTNHLVKRTATGCRMLVVAFGEDLFGNVRGVFCRNINFLIMMYPWIMST